MASLVYVGTIVILLSGLPAQGIGPPRNFQYVSLNLTAVYTTWEKPDGAGSDVQYNVLWSLGDNTQDVVTSDTHRVITYLKPGSNYSITILPLYNQGSGQPLNTSLTTPTEDWPTPQPENINLGRVNGSLNYKLTWGVKNESFLYRYYIEFSSAFQRTDPLVTKASFIELPLNYSTKYEFHVTAIYNLPLNQQQNRTATLRFTSARKDNNDDDGDSLPWWAIVGFIGGFVVLAAIGVYVKKRQT